METDLVLLRGVVAAPLLGPDMHQDGAAELERAAEGVHQRPEVVAGHDADVRDPKVLEELARLGEADDRLAHPPRELERGGPHHRDPLHRPVVDGPRLLPGVRELDLREVLRERADGLADRHLVVVEHDQDLHLAMPDVVERLERQAAHEGRVAHDHGDPLEALAGIPGRGEPGRDREPRTRVTPVEHVVLALRAARKPADAAQLAQRPEPLVAARDELVRVGLVAGVPDDRLAR